MEVSKGGRSASPLYTYLPLTSVMPVQFGFEFDVYDKIEVNGPGTHPIYQILKRQQPISQPSSSSPLGAPGAIEWK